MARARCGPLFPGKNLDRDSAAAALQELFGGVQFAVLAGVVEGDIAVGTFLAKVDLTSVEGLRINVDADGALVEFGEIQNLMDGLERVDVGRMSGVHFIDVGWNNAAGAAGPVAGGKPKNLRL